MKHLLRVLVALVVFVSGCSGPPERTAYNAIVAIGGGVNTAMQVCADLTFVQKTMDEGTWQEIKAAYDGTYLPIYKSSIAALRVISATSGGNPAEIQAAVQKAADEMLDLIKRLRERKKKLTQVPIEKDYFVEVIAWNL